MFGYILANRDALTEEQQERYRALYCALCRTLGKEYGTLAKLSLSYDMVMLILMLNTYASLANVTNVVFVSIHALFAKSAKVTLLIIVVAHTECTGITYVILCHLLTVNYKVRKINLIL